MKKLSVISTLTLSSLLLASCATIKTPIEKKSPSPAMADLMETVELRDQDIFEPTPKNGEYTHALVEADADDQKIKTTVGDADIDRELPDSDADRAPYSRNFLSPKKTKRMQFWVDYFTNKNRDRFQRFINNGEEYRPAIEKVLEAHGLPKELYFVGLIESGYYLGARSHAAAVGPWQFIRGTGTRYGLRITPEIDERQDLFKATRAAAMYFKDLHNVFSSWELALSAYNAGEYGIIRRIMKHGTRDFYELSRNKQLPSETINYVPKVLAAMHVVANAEKYGFTIPKKKHRLFDLTELRPIKKNVPLATIARRLNVSVDLLRKLNPELRRNATPKHFSGTYYLRIPQSRYAYQLPEADTAVTLFAKPESKKELVRRTAFIERSISVDQSAAPVAIVRPRIHRVRRGETFVAIARRYEIPPRELAKLNGLRNWKTSVQVGQRLKLTASAPQRLATRTVAPKVRLTNRPIVYEIRKGDNLTDLAKLFDIKLSKIKKANNLRRGRVLVGQRIVLPDTRKGIYTVRKGDHLTKVARELRQPVEAIVKLNSLKRGAIYPGQKIIVNMD
jgi:membrane-bound lytic murein transglycosylase D